MKRIEFVGYDGKYPCLCMGSLTIKVEGEIHHLRGILRSGGGISNDYSEIEEGPWEVDLSDYPELEPYKKEITDVVNENIDYGCCGGCI